MAPRPLTGAQRNRLLRDRQQNGIIVLSVPVHEDDVVAALQDVGLLRPDYDKPAIAEALAAFISAWAAPDCGTRHDRMNSARGL